MVHTDENALICDLAETYHIYDYRSLPVFTVAALSAGLRENSRIMTIMRGGILVSPEYVTALIYDLLADLLRCKNEESLARMIDGEVAGKKDEPERPTMAFDSAEAYERAKRKAIGED